MIAEDWIKIKISKKRCIMIKQAQKTLIMIIIKHSRVLYNSRLSSYILGCFHVQFLHNFTLFWKVCEILHMSSQDIFISLYLQKKSSKSYVEFTFTADSHGKHLMQWVLATWITCLNYYFICVDKWKILKKNWLT